MLELKTKKNGTPEQEKFKKFIDFDKRHHVFFDNLYVEDLKIVIKHPLIVGQHNKTDIPDLKVEKFNLTKYTFLTPY
ncbi:MAG: hypothetical protein R6U96_13695 [Promethearchaeia archaeon]